MVSCPLRRRQTPLPPFDGLVVGVTTVPLVVSSVFLLVERNSAVGGGLGEEELLLGQSWGDGGAGFGVCAGGVELAEYLEVVLEGSVLCVVCEVSFSTLPPGSGSSFSRGCEPPTPATILPSKVRCALSGKKQKKLNKRRGENIYSGVIHQGIFLFFCFVILNCWRFLDVGAGKKKKAE